jgi:rhodanese-related sulfurtransferase
MFAFSLLKKRLRLKTIALPAVFFSLVLLNPLSAAHGGTIPEKMLRRGEKAVAPGLLVSAETLIGAKRPEKRPLLIDIRSKEAFASLHIAGAMNIPLHGIKTKTFLKSSPLVLVDRGLSYHRLAPVCGELRKMGFDARILDGGMNAWSRHGGPMVGDLVRQMAFRRISPADFFHEKNYRSRVVCDVSATRSEASLRLMPYALHLPLDGDRESRRWAIEKFKSTHARNGTADVLVVNTDGDRYDRIMRAFDRAGFTSVFCLDGGVDAYGTYLDNLILSWRPRERRTATHRPCRSCGEKK